MDFLVELVVCYGGWGESGFASGWYFGCVGTILGLVGWGVGCWVCFGWFGFVVCGEFPEFGAFVCVCCNIGFLVSFGVWVWFIRGLGLDAGV